MFPLLFAAVATWELVLYGLLGAGGVIGIGALAWRLGDKKEAVAKRFVKSAGFFEGLGFKYLPEGLLCLGTDDTSGALRAVEQFDDLLQDEVALSAHMQEITIKMATKLMDDNMAFCERLKQKVDAVYLVEHNQRKTEAETEAARQLRDREKLDDEIALRELKKELDVRKAQAAANPPAAKPALPTGV